MFRYRRLFGRRWRRMQFGTLSIAFGEVVTQLGDDDILPEPAFDPRPLDIVDPPDRRDNGMGSALSAPITRGSKGFKR
jgi:hypothetical protein